MGIKEYITGFGLGLALCIGAGNYLYRGAAEKKIECLENKLDTTEKSCVSRDEGMLKMMETARKAFESSYEIGKLKHESLQKQVQQLKEITSKYQISECRESLRQIEESTRKGIEALRQGREVLESRSSGGLDIPYIPLLPKEMQENTEKEKSDARYTADRQRTGSEKVTHCPDVPVIPQDILQNMPEAKLYEIISQNLKNSFEYLRQIREDTRKAMQASEETRRLLQGSSKTIPDFPRTPIIPLPEEKPADNKKEPAEKNE